METDVGGKMFRSEFKKKFENFDSLSHAWNLRRYIISLCHFASSPLAIFLLNNGNVSTFVQTVFC